MMIKEFGSDFHTVKGYNGHSEGIDRLMPVYFADGRMALQHVILHNHFKRIWVPKYFCYEVLHSLTNQCIEWLPYPDYPEADDVSIIGQIPFKPGDALLRMNFFGLRKRRDNSRLDIPVIEDHSHGLFTDWAQNSNADFCIASLRKSLPLPEGGIVWSPKGLSIPVPQDSTEVNSQLVYDRSLAMRLKSLYLEGHEQDKEMFRNIYMRTEDGFDRLEVCNMSILNRRILDALDSEAFDRQKRANWRVLTQHLSNKIDYLRPESETNTPFSLILKFQDKNEREKVRFTLIKNLVFPAILWKIPDEDLLELPFYLSIHCDGRYNEADMQLLAKIINDAFRN